MPPSAPSFSRSRFRVALEGFSDFERATLASFFRLVAERSPSYAPVAAAAQGDFLVADADLPTAVTTVHALGRLTDTVFVGARAPAGAMARLARPIDPLAIVRQLDAQVALRRAAQAAVPAGPAPAGPAHAVDLWLDLGNTAAAADRAAPDVAAGRQGGGGRDVLVVGDGPIERQSLAQRLHGMGYRVQMAASGREAIDAVDAAGARSFAIVFLDVAPGGPHDLDGWRVCHHVKQRGSAAPAVVMVTGRATESDRVRGTLAGCDACLVKPLLDAAFLRTLRAVDPAFDWPAAAPG